ncbi:MAG: ATP-binding protein [Gemmatimonadaceae bacterium]
MPARAAFSSAWDAVAGDSNLAQVFAQAPVGLAVLQGRELRYTFANPRYQAIIGSRDPCGKRLIEMFPELAGSEIEGVIEGVFDTLTPFSANDLLIRFDSHGTGEIDNYYDLVYQPLVSLDGTPRGVLVVAVDVTVRHELRVQQRALDAAKRARAVAESEAARLGAMFLQGPAFVAVLRGSNYVIEMANDHYQTLIGHRDVLGKPLAEVLPEIVDQGFLELLDAVMATGIPHVANEVPVRFIRAKGGPLEERIVSFVYQAVNEADHTRSGIFAHGVDVTDTVRAREAVEITTAALVVSVAAERSARAEADTANRAKGDFLARMSHDLRTPLDAIFGYAEILAMGIRGPVNETQITDLRRIQRSQRHLLGLIDGILQYAQINAGAESYDLQPIQLADVLATCEALTAPQFHANGLELRVAGCNPSVIAVGDSGKTHQIVINLLSNAIKFTPAGGRVVIACDENTEGWVELRVADSGTGIAAVEIERVFEPFVQVGAADKRGEGHGLGLAISRDFARGMGGDLTVKSSPAGSEFTLLLPALRRSDRSALDVITGAGT